MFEAPPPDRPAVAAMRAVSPAYQVAFPLEQADNQTAAAERARAIYDQRWRIRLGPEIRRVKAEACASVWIVSFYTEVVP